MNINFIGVPLKYGCDRKGADYAPNKLRDHGVIDLFKKRHNIYDLGNIYVPLCPEEEKFSDHKRMKYLNPIIEVNRNLAHQVYTSLLSKNFPLVVGGDHSLAIGSIAGSSSYFENLGVIWIDAHSDINTGDSSPSGNIHGMPLGASLGFGHRSLVGLYNTSVKVKKENVYILGAREMDSGEVQLALENNLKLYTMDRIKEVGYKNILNSILKDIRDRNLDGVHLSFDLDSIDKSLVPGTGTPVDSGFSKDEVMDILGSLLDSRLIRSMDFVEFNPLLDHDNKTLNLCMDLFTLISERLSY